MDHLPLPQDAKPFITVPYKGIEYYDHGGFMKYPERKGWSEQDLEGKNHFGGRSDEEIEAFFQTWLFFGFAIEILKDAGIYVTTEDFLVTEPTEATQNGRVVTTKSLPSLLVKWKRLWPLPEGVSPDCTCRSCLLPNRNKCTEKPCWNSFRNARDSDACHNVREILIFANRILDRYCTRVRSDQIAGQKGAQAWPVRPEIATSIIALRYTLGSAATTIYDIPHWMLIKESTSSSSLLRERLNEKWCKSDSDLMMKTFQIDGHYYLAASASPSEEYLKAHSLFTEARCTAKVEDGTYLTRHAPYCSCKTNIGHISGSFANLGEADFEIAVRGIIDHDGGTPIILWDEGRRKIKAIEYNAKHQIKPKYVAISHVWADGMGNPKENWLPECQLSRIQEMVDELNFPGREPEDQVGFWMDTLCVPVKSEFYAYRKCCIGNMRQIYTDAAAVLVLDPWLQEIPHTAPVSDRCVRLYQSNWQHRLWTFQEGALAQELYIQFSDKSQHFRDLQDERVAFEEDSAAHGIYSTFNSLAEISVTLAFMLVKGCVSRIVTGEDSPSERWTLFLPLVDLLRSRQTSHLADEIVCLSTILGLDPNPYLDIHEGKSDDVADRRMELFLKTIKKFDAGLIFSSVPRLERNGFRWAPRSVLGLHSSILGGLGDNQKARLRQMGPFFGLVVKYPGFKCKLGSVAKHLSATARKIFAISIERSMRPSVHYEVELQPNSVKWDSNIKYGLVMARQLDRADESLAMVGSVVPLPKGQASLEINVLQFECNAMVRRCSEAPSGHVILPVSLKNRKWMIT